jgi:hypothetical protein
MFLRMYFVQLRIAHGPGSLVVQGESHFASGGKIFAALSTLPCMDVMVTHQHYDP